MGCCVSCVNRKTMLLFGRHSNGDSNAQAKLERKLYLAKESPESDFDLSDCQMRRVPSGIYSICKVFRKQQLYLNDNKLQSLEDGGLLSDLYLITVLNLSCNKFSELPNDIRYLISLTELYLQDNLIQLIPEEIHYLTSLQILDVSKNRLVKLTPQLGKLKNLRQLNITLNKDLNELCPELCLAVNITLIQLDGEQFTFPSPDVIAQGTIEIMKFLCDKMNVVYTVPIITESDMLSLQSPTFVQDPFARPNTISWEEQEAVLIEQENKIHEAAKQQREKFLSEILQEQVFLDSEIAKVHEVREKERQRLIKAIQKDEQGILSLVRNFIQSDHLKPEIIQQQLAHEQAEHDRLLDLTRQNYDNVKKADVLKAMERLIEEDYNIQHSKKNYEDTINNVKQSMLLQELEGAEKLQDLLKVKDESRTVLVQNLLENQVIQKAAVASLIERVDARSWSLNEEISLISSNLAKLSVLEQEKKKLHVTYNYNELLHERMQLVNLLDDLLDQKSKRRKQLIQTLSDMEIQRDTSTDFWLKNYQKLLESTPKTLLNVGKHLDPLLANYLLQEGVIHCLPFLVKFLFSDESLLNIKAENLKENGVLLSTDRDGIIRAINHYVGAKSRSLNLEATPDITASPEPSAPIQAVVEEPTCTGVVTTTEENLLESECVVCMDNRCEIVFVPCGHMCCCQECAHNEMEICPMCRSDIERKIKVIVA